jgi:hypothetical protein
MLEEQQEQEQEQEQEQGPVGWAGVIPSFFSNFPSISNIQQSPSTLQQPFNYLQEPS